MATRTTKLSYKDLELPKDDIEAFKNFFGLSLADEKRLAELQLLAKDYNPRLIEEFYTHILDHPETKKFFSDPATLQRVKKQQAAYFEQLTSGHYGADYLDSRLEMGTAHDAINLGPKWFIGSFSYYVDAIAKEFKPESGDKSEAAYENFRSLVKLMFFDMAVGIEAFEDIVADLEQALA